MMITRLLILILSSATRKVESHCPLASPCYPAPLNVAKHPSHRLTINSTCGTPPETFCVDNDCSFACDATDNRTWHPPRHIQDSYEQLTYWKSSNSDEPVHVQFDFNNKLLLQQITITFQFELPSALYIERSNDYSKTYTTLAYFAGNCFRTFGMQEAVKYHELDVLCFSINPGTIQRQISYAPRRNDYVATEVLKGGAVRDFYVASNVRIVLHEFYKPADFDRRYANKHKYYFSIRDVDVQATCFCNGMSQQCSAKDHGRCICRKYTEGMHCERCLKAYNNKEWTFGKSCEPCECNRHATECVYDEAKKHGVCQYCRHHTRGDHCETCEIGYYRNASKAVTNMQTCVPCNCYETGVLRGSNTCDPTTGKCYCKPNVDGFLCDRCKDGYYGLTSSACGRCLPCACRPSGSVSLICDKVSGICPCKLGFTGRSCSECVVGFFGYPVYNPTECRVCACRPSGAVSMLCDITGQCTCRQNFYGVKCEQIKIGFYSASVNQMLFSSIDAVIKSPVTPVHQSLNIKDSSGNTFGVLGYSLRLGGSLITDVTQINFRVKTPATTIYDVYLQYITSYNFDDVVILIELKSEFRNTTCDRGSVAVATRQQVKSDIPASTESKQLASPCLIKGHYDILVKFPPKSAGSLSHSAKIFIISLLLLPNYKYTSRYLTATADIQSHIRRYYHLASSYQLWPKKESGGAKYLSYVYGSIYTVAFDCGCNTMGSLNAQVCNVYGGQCNCKRNIYGRICNRCLPQHYNFLSGLGCDPCNCDRSGSFSKDCSYHTGRCRCKPNVIGRNCNKCRPGFYGIGSGNGCKPCNCLPSHTKTPQCKEDGSCICKPGITSSKCDQCQPGFYQIGDDGCKKCRCSPLGALHNKCNPITGSCTCKERVTGALCDRCVHGFYGFSSDFPQICLQCYCNGRTHECDVAKDFYILNVSTSFNILQNPNSVMGWHSVDIKGEATGDTVWQWAPIYHIRRGYAKLLDNGDRTSPHLFFSAPKKFLGHRLSSYMHRLRFDLTQEAPEDDALGYTKIGDVVIKGVGLPYKLVTRLLAPPLHDLHFRHYEIQFYEKLWHRDDLDGDHPSGLEMRTTLMNLEYIWIRGKWTKSNGKYSGLSNVSMQYSSYNVANKTGLRSARNMEYCVCPREFNGQFCEKCRIGYRKDATQTPFACVACNCHKHAVTCDPQNGTCVNCLHHTAGPACDRCADDFFGDPKSGTETDCKPCACPGGVGVPNQFTNKCVSNPSNPKRPYRCIDCLLGYTGDRCHICSDGYYGNPEKPFGKCRKCICNGHINPNAKSNCNTTTGECLRCLYNTVGPSCQFCKPGFYGNAINEVCRYCACSDVGAFDNKCHNITGQCNCKPNVSGRQCDWL